jgi:hypothetical protein
MKTLWVILALVLTVSAAEATPPTIAAPVCGESAPTSSTSHTVTKPVGIQVGEVWFACITINGVRTQNWTGAGFTELTDSSSGAAESQSCAYRFVTGSEGASVVVTSSAAEVSQFCSWRISGNYPSAPPEAGTPANGASVSPNPPSKTASWGDDDNAFIVVVSTAATATFTASPASYANCGQPTSTLSIDMRGCDRTKSGAGSATDDPGVFTISPSQDWIANTFVFRPAATSGCTGARLGLTGVSC